MSMIEQPPKTTLRRPDIRSGRGRGFARGLYPAIALLCALASSVQGCKPDDIVYYDNGTGGYGGYFMLKAQRAATSYRTDVFPAFAALSCSTSSCHSAQDTSLAFADPEVTYSHLYKTSQRAQQSRLNFAVPELSALLLVMQGSHEAGFSHPRLDRQLRPEEPLYELVLDWIQAGAPNN